MKYEIKSCSKKIVIFLANTSLNLPKFLANSLEFQPCSKNFCWVVASKKGIGSPIVELVSDSICIACLIIAAGILL